MSLQPVDSKTIVTAADQFSDHLPYHAKAVEACLASLKSTLQGLSEEEAETRKKEAGKGAPKLDINNTPRDIFIKSLKKYISLLFIAAAGLSFALGQPTEGILIFVVMLANTGVQGLIQWKSLKPRQIQDDDNNIRCSVRRNGKTMTVNASDLVLGDILLIAGGQIMPTDARLISSYQIQVDESLLTGESVLVPKNANEILHPLEDVTAQVNMLFAGTVVKTGKGEAMVTALGHETVMGKIATLAKTTEKRESPFTKRLNLLTFKIFLFVLATSVVVIAAGSARGIPLLQLFQVALVMGIVAFPETIPGLASLILSLGVNRLNEKKVHIKSFEAIETIGDVQVICTDKTGTLTENYLLFEQLFMPMVGALPYDPQWQKGEGIPNKAVEDFLRIGRLNNGTMVEGLRSPLMGDPIDVAIYRAAPPSLEAGYHQRVSIPFDPVTLRSATLCETPSGQVVSMIKGAPESVIEICKYFMKPDGSIGELSITQRSEFLMFNRKLAYENNLRVIGFAQKPMAQDDHTGPYSDAIFMGWACLLDPAKPGVVEAIEQLQRAKTKLIMITGDQKATAEITARELGIIRRNSDEVWLRSDLEAWEEPKIPDTVRVFARTKPEEKLDIVESLQRGGNIVAMVGDGVNDSPALQKSDVAIAMGMQGSDAAKESADIILMNDRLEGIVQAILESRILRRKIQSCMRYLLSCNLGLILFVAAAIIGGLGLPINVIQMLWLNLVIISIPSLVLAIEPIKEEELEIPELPNEGDTKNFKAKKSETTVSIDALDQNHLFLIFFWGTLMMVGGICAYLLCTMVFKLPIPVAKTTTFCTLALIQTLNLFNVQALNAGENRRNFVSELTSTPITWIVLIAAMVLQVVAIYVPGVNTLLGTTPMSIQAALIAAGMGIGTIIFSLKTMKV